MTDRAELHAEAAKARAGRLTGQQSTLPCGDARRDDVKLSTQFRASTVERDGREFSVVEGYASTVERQYEMWDEFGPYNEVVARTAFDKTLAADPLVVFRFNHAGTPMASTRNGRLELWSDAGGLGDRAYLNPQRDDVQLLMHAIKDGDVTEQSFMFHIDEGVWSDDFTEYRIQQANLDRGDVGPVSYGANPTTSVAARGGELLAAIPELSPLVAREAYTLLTARKDVETRQATPMLNIDPDEDPAALAAALDAVLDAALSYADPANPDSVAQCFALLTAAEQISDQLLEAMGLDDPDDPDTGRAAAVQKITRQLTHLLPRAKAEPPKARDTDTGKSVRLALAQLELDKQRS